MQYFIEVPRRKKAYHFTLFRVTFCLPRTSVTWLFFDAAGYITATESHTQLISYLVKRNIFIHFRLQDAEFPLLTIKKLSSNKYFLFSRIRDVYCTDKPFGNGVFLGTRTRTRTRTTYKTDIFNDELLKKNNLF